MLFILSYVGSNVWIIMASHSTFTMKLFHSIILKIFNVLIIKMHHCKKITKDGKIQETKISTSCSSVPQR